MKELGVWIIILVASVLAFVLVYNIDDLQCVIEKNSMWWHVPLFCICLFSAVNSGIVILNRLFN